MSVASPSDAGYDVTALQEMLDDYEWQVSIRLPRTRL